VIDYSHYLIFTRSKQCAVLNGLTGTLKNHCHIFKGDRKEQILRKLNADTKSTSWKGAV